MPLLLAGITVWCLVHLLPGAAPGSRENLVSKLGDNRYKGLFSLFILASLLMIVFGWKAAVPTHVYAPPFAPGVVPSALVLIGLILFFSARLNGTVKRFVRHPQLTGVIAWSAAHLLANGDSRSVALFGALGVWAVLEIVFINRREGSRGALPALSLRQDAMAVVIGGGAFALIMFFHESLFGVAVLT
jgi:uncharacterized membrane protein